MTNADQSAPGQVPRHRIRHGVVLVLATALFLGSVGYAASYSQSWVGLLVPAPADEPSCRSTVTPAPRPGAITLNVYNATDQGGLATQVAKALRARDFKVAAVGNDPKLALVEGPGAVRYGRRGADAAQVVSRQLNAAKLIEDDRTSATVDLVIGLAFQELVPVPPKPPPAPGAFALNVYNTTFRTGLARTVAKQMAGRGFRTGRVANDPLRKMLAGAGEIRHGDDGQAAAKVVAQHLPGATLVKDQRAGTSVDLVVGNAFTGLVPTADVPAPPAPTRTPTPMVTHTSC